MSGEKLAQNKGRSQTPTVKKTVWEKIMFPLNNRRKKIALLVTLFFAFLAHSELEVLFWEIPDFNQLTITEGKIKITTVIARTGSIDTLIINKQKIPFNCGLPAVSRRDCVPSSKIHDFQGKTGKVWWYKGKETVWDNDTRVYQLEVDGNLEIVYQVQKEKYLSMKNYYFYPNMLFFVLSIIMFFLMQFANDPITSKRNEK